MELSFSKWWIRAFVHPADNFIECKCIQMKYIVTYTNHFFVLTACKWIQIEYIVTSN